METEKITQEFEKGFNRSSKIMEHILGIDEARLLSTLIYKHNYWADEKELIDIKGKQGFYTIISDLQIETNMKPYSISKALKNLVIANLIEIHKIGLPAKNHYVINAIAVMNFDKNHVHAYDKWAEGIRTTSQADTMRFPISDKTKTKVESNGATPLILPKSRENSTTSGEVFEEQVIDFSTVTNNKNTNNKILITTTNRTSAEELHEKYLDELIVELDFLIDPNREYDESNSRFINLMKRIVPQFEKFIISHRDSIMIERIGEYSLNSNEIAFKILSNVSDIIIDGKKEIRFGNLFVGLEEMNENKELNYLSYGT